MKEEVLRVVSDLQEIREENHIEPKYVTLLDIQRELTERAKAALNELCSEGVLEWSRTVNQVPQFMVKR